MIVERPAHFAAILKIITENIPEVIMIKAYIFSIGIFTLLLQCFLCVLEE